MDTNLRIPTDLGTVTIGKETYNVTAAEGAGENAGDIVLTITSGTSTKIYAIAGDLKIKGINIGATSENIAGTYFAGGNSSYPSLTFNEDETIQQGEGISGFENTVWSYDQNSNKISFAKADGYDGELVANEAEILTIKENGTVVNKIIMLNSDGRKYFLSTTQAGLCPFEGTYIQDDDSNRKFVFEKENCSFMQYKYQSPNWVQDDSYSGSYAVINGEFYVRGESCGPINQINNYEKITIYGDINCTLQQ